MAEIIILMNANQELQVQEKLSMKAQEEHSTFESEESVLNAHIEKQ